MFEESPPPPLYQFSLPPSSIGPPPTTSSRLMSTASAGGIGHPGQFYYQMMPPPPQISHARDQFMSNNTSQRDSNYAQLVNGDLFNQVAAGGNSQLSPNSVINDSLYIVIICV